MATSNVSDWQDAIDSALELIEEWGQNAELQTRDIKNPTLNSVDYDETFTKVSDVIIAIDTENVGTKTFDGIGVADERQTSVSFYLEWINGITSENFILYSGRRFEIVSVDNIGELNGVAKLNVLERGLSSKEASKA